MTLTDTIKDAFTRWRQRFGPPPLDPRRLEVVALASSQTGVQDPDQYWRLVQPRLVGSGAAWCGGFALWCLRRAGLTQGVWVIGLGFLYRLPQTRKPLPGDLAYFQHLQHHAIVATAPDRLGFLQTWDGNQAGETVQRKVRNVKEVTAFYSISGLLLGDDPLRRPYQDHEDDDGKQA
jgi:hypothetical protein